MRNSSILSCLLFFLVFSEFSLGQEVQITENKNGEKFWLINSEGKRISKKYGSLRPLNGVSNLHSFDVPYFVFTRKNSPLTRGIVDVTGKVIVKDTLNGYLNYLNESRFFCSNYEDVWTVYTFDGQIDSTYSENLVFIEDDAIIKEKNGRFAVFSLNNVQLTEFIYVDYDTGDFRERNDPPILVYMVLDNDIVHEIGFDGEIISVYDPNSTKN